MKILIATDMNIEFICGSTYSLKRAGKLLIEHGHSVEFICPGRTHKFEKYIFDDIAIWGVPSFPVVLQKNLRFAFPIVVNHSIRKALLEYKPDIIHIQSHGPLPASVVRIAHKMNIPVVGTNHFVPENVIHSMHIPEFLKPLVAKIAWKHLIHVFNTLEYVITPTKTAASILKKSGFTKAITVISNGVNCKKFTPQGRGKYLYQKYSLPKKSILLFVGRLDPEKNVDILIYALHTILHNKVEAHAVIVGTGNQMLMLKNLTKNLELQENVTFTGFLSDEDLPNIYHISSCFVMPGNAELQSIATMEAMASGLPILAANAMALPELVHDKENGYLFTHGKSQELANQAMALLSNEKLRRQMSRKSLQIIQTHDINKTINEYESIYQKAIFNKNKSIHPSILNTKR